MVPQSTKLLQVEPCLSGTGCKNLSAAQKWAAETQATAQLAGTSYFTAPWRYLWAKPVANCRRNRPRRHQAVPNFNRSAKVPRRSYTKRPRRFEGGGVGVVACVVWAHMLDATQLHIQVSCYATASARTVRIMWLHALSWHTCWMLRNCTYKSWLYSSCRRQQSMEIRGQTSLYQICECFPQ